MARCMRRSKSCLAKSLPDVSTLWLEKVTQKKKIEKLTQRRIENFSARKDIVANNRHTGDAVAAQDKLTE